MPEAFIQIEQLYKTFDVVNERLWQYYCHLGCIDKPNVEHPTNIEVYTGFTMGFRPYQSPMTADGVVSFIKSLTRHEFRQTMLLFDRSISRKPRVVL